MSRKTLVLAVLLLSSTLSAQQPRVDETIEVSIVNVDVLVTDKKGNRVTGLTVDDFEIREEGKIQPITNFAEYLPAAMGTGASIEAGPQPAETAAAAAPRARRTIVLFVESTRLTPVQSKQMFDSVRTMLQDAVAPGDRVTIVTWNKAVLVRQAFTDDLPTLEKVLAELETELVRHGPRDDGREARRQQAESDADAALMEATGMPPVSAIAAAKRQYAQIRQKTAVIEALMQSISGLDGRKIIVLAMRRFGAHAGAEYFGGEVPFESRSEFDTVKFRDSIIRTANAHGITLYTLFPAGLAWDPDDASIGVAGSSSPEGDLTKSALQNKILFNEATALQDLAESTGGLMAWGAANIAEMLPRVADDLEAFYSLGYRARATGKDITRKIVVKTKNPRYEVRSRRQFVEKSDETRMNDRVIANLYQPVEGSTIRFEAGLGAPKADGRKRWTIMLRIRIPIASLTTLQQGRANAGEFSIYVVTGAVVGVMSDVQRRAQPFQIPVADLQKAKGSHFTYDFTLRVDETVDRVSVGLLDEVSKEFGFKRIAIPPRKAK